MSITTSGEVSPVIKATAALCEIEHPSSKHGLEVTAVDFNGKEFDGQPLKGISLVRNIADVLGKLFTDGDIKIKPYSNTDYAVWNVKLPDGSIVEAYPGDFIKLDENYSVLDVIKYAE